MLTITTLSDVDAMLRDRQYDHIPPAAASLILRGLVDRITELERDAELLSQTVHALSCRIRELETKGN